MGANKTGVVGIPDPDFEPDPNEKHVWDPVKCVYRKVSTDQDDETAEDVENGSR